MWFATQASRICSMNRAYRLVNQLLVSEHGHNIYHRFNASIAINRGRGRCYTFQATPCIAWGMCKVVATFRQSFFQWELDKVHDKRKARVAEEARKLQLAGSHRGSDDDDDDDDELQAAMRVSREEELKKLRRGGKDRPPGIILRRDRNMVPTEKILEPWPPSLAGCHRPLCNSPAGGWRAGRNPGAGEAHRWDFFNQARNSPPRGIKSRNWRCYSEALTFTLEALSREEELRSRVGHFFYHKPKTEPYRTEISVFR
jgi:hypothetical protein